MHPQIVRGQVARGLIYIDDGIWITDDEDVGMMTALILLFVKMVGPPISWEKTKMGQEQEWCGYAVSFKEGAVGLTPAKRGYWGKVPRRSGKVNNGHRSGTYRS